MDEQNNVTYQPIYYIIVLILVLQVTLLYFLVGRSLPFTIEIYLIALTMLIAVPFLRNPIRSLTEPIGIALMAYFGLVTSTIRLGLDEFASPLLRVAGVTSYEQIVQQVHIALLYGILGLVLFYIGYWGIRAKVKNLSVRQRFANLRMDPQRMYSVIIVLTVIGMAGLIYFALSEFGLFVFVRDTRMRANITSEGSGLLATQYFRIILNLIPTASVIWVSHVRKDATITERVLLGLYILLSSFIFFLYGGRNFIATYWFTLILIYVLRRDTRVGFRQLVLIGLVAAMAMVYFLSVLVIRRSQRGGDIQADRIESVASETYQFEAVIEILSGPDFVDVDTMVIVQSIYPETRDYELGQTYLNLIYAPIPRQIWPDKPVAVGRILASNYDTNRQAGTPPSVIGEAYMNFGPLGIPLIMLAYGFFLQVVKQSFNVSGKMTNLEICVYSMLMPRLTFLFTIVSFSQAVTGTLVFVIPLFITLSFIYVRSPETPMLK